MNSKVLEALEYINVQDLHYFEWINVGMALKAEGFDCSVWDNWSQNDTRYKKGACQKKWETFKNSGLSGGTIIKMAKDRGYSSFYFTSKNMILDWNDTIEYDGEEDRIIGLGLSPTGQLKAYLQALFNENDIVGYVTNDVFLDKESGKYAPKKGVYNRTAKEIIAELDRHPDDIGYAIGDSKKEAGAWIRFNPLNGLGVNKENVTRFDYCLLESDEIPLEEQINFFKEYNLPIAALVFSGGKSIHAITHIDAENAEIYGKRVQNLYEFCKSHHFPVDESNKNPNKLSRLPGVKRNDVEQTLLAINIGEKNYEEWLNYIDGQEELICDDIADLVKDPPPLAPAIIDGVLRKGHKLLLSGASKSGKSFTLIQLAICLAEGIPFLGKGCMKSKVVYINFEIDRASSIHRFKEMYRALGIENPSKNIIALNLRGKSKPLNKFVPILVKKFMDKGVDVFIIDPIYKVITGDENNASEMANFCNQFDIICDKLGATVVYAHHHSKGEQGSKYTQDRASGSGVFARDPDALIDFNELVLDEDFINKVADANFFDTAWQVEYVTREFAKPKPQKIWFKYPLHVAADDELSGFYPRGDIHNAQKANPNCSTLDERKTKLEEAFNIVSMMRDEVPVGEIAQYLQLSEKTVIRYVNQHEDFEYSKGLVRRKQDNDENDQ